MYEKYKQNGFEVLSVAVDLQGPGVVKPHIQNTSFKTVVDTENKLADMFGFKMIPNGIFVDRGGVVRLIKEGFHVTEDDHLEAVKTLIFKEAEKVELDKGSNGKCQALSPLETELAQTKYKLAMVYASQDEKEAALKELDEALRIDPENFVIRKQRWYLRYPEKFSPSIDFEWQKQQLEKEKVEEAQLTNDPDCGPDECNIEGETKPRSEE
ncbi:hypothetical protein SAMN05518684_11459 [Salipaludibacillus aurantiacus]|uniref:Uncharacterized protein n=1 Tax=Salipaludibacillus aurantiacus TaxID=1601833 RepID=A0A1H9W411_9BACI|nr:hypothetical protein SAMN05518684_11459 [Salipaludibacillus aurantiacus]